MGVHGGGHQMGVHGGIGWCTWGHWKGVHGGIGRVVHGGIGWVYMGALDGCTWMALDAQWFKNRGHVDISEFRETNDML